MFFREFCELLIVKLLAVLKSECNELRRHVAEVDLCNIRLNFCFWFRHFDANGHCHSMMLPTFDLVA